MSEYQDAFRAGEQACARHEHPDANPYKPRRVHVLADPPGPKQYTLARMWLRGWQHHAQQHRRNPPATV